MKEHSRSIKGAVESDATTELSDFHEIFLRSQETVRTIGSIMSKLKQTTHEWGDLYVERSSIQLCQRHILMHIAALLLLISANEKATKKDINPTEYGEDLMTYLHSTQGFFNARTIVEEYLFEEFGQEIWLPTIHTVIYKAREKVAKLFPESV